MNQAGVPATGNMNIFPNPADNTVSITFTMTNDEPVTISLVDMNGKLVKELTKDKRFAKGDHLITDDLKDVSQGVYMVIMRSSTETHSKKLTILNK